MRRPAVGILALALAAACAIPSEPPNWDVVWNLPMPDSGQTISVTSFLPSGVTLVGTAPNQLFNAQVSAVPPISRTLGAQCPTCPNATAPKPAFTAPVATTTISLAAGTALNSGTLATGSQIAIALNNGFTFDPIRPPGGSPGTVTLTVSNGAATLGTLTLAGATSAIPASSVTNVTIPLSGTVNTASPITVSMTMDSPAGAAGSPVAMNSSQTFTATPTPTVTISQANVTIAAQAIPSTPNPVDLSGDPMSALERRVADSATTQGSMFLLISNPLSIGANVTLTFTGTKLPDDGGPNPVPVAIVPVTKTAVIPAGGPTAATTTVRVDFTGQELRRILGAALTVSLSGTTGAGSTVVTPASSITIFSRIQLRAYMREFE